MRSRRSVERPVATSALPEHVTRELLAQVATLEAKEKELDATLWAKERLAEQCGQMFDELWDAINRSTNKLAMLAQFGFGEITIPELKPPQALAHEIRLHEASERRATWTSDRWREWLAESARAGWELVQCEFRHTGFEIDPAGQPARSTYTLSAHLLNAPRQDRAMIEGELLVEWGPKPAADALHKVERIDARGLKVKTRQGEPGFRPIFVETLAPPQGSFFIDPLILYDLDGDGTSETVLAAKNLVFRRRSPEFLESGPLCRQWPGLVFTALIADFDGDAAADFLYAKFEGLFLVKGTPHGNFDETPRQVWSAEPHLKYAQALTCGDIDGDGDLDVWLGQYKVPYNQGQMPTPYYDANDGHPAYLFQNDGRGNLTDMTAAAGLGPKRWRRTYSGSLVDLDDDGDLDLAVVSDFSGLDLYANDGRGHFTDVTDQWASERSAAGMSHAVADFDRDGRLDLLMIGMPSPTVDRLNQLGLARPGLPDDAMKRGALMFGNRLLLARAGGGFAQTPLSESIARTGWSWGCSAFDFDNDGWLDVYIATGHETKQFTRDYETEFWLHDAYVATSKPDLALAAYLSTKQGRTRGRGWSFGGWEKNRLCLSQGGRGFLDVGHLMGVALEADSRNVATDDLDGDGQLDLLVTTFEAWPEVKQTLQIFHTTLPAHGHWIGVRLREEGNGLSPVGARLTVRAGETKFVRQIITGDSFRTQFANTVHFGLGDLTRVDELEVRWLNGRKVVLRQPAVDRYHDVRAVEALKR